MSTGSTTEWISAISSAIAAVGVLFAFWQLMQSKIISQLQFEDSLSKEYRDLLSHIPKRALLGSNLSAQEQLSAFDEIYRYIDLTNEQICLRQQNRISLETWSSWACGIQANLSLPAFKWVWEEIKANSNNFSELRRLEFEGFGSDPRKWKVQNGEPIALEPKSLASIGPA